MREAGSGNAVLVRIVSPLEIRGESLFDAEMEVVLNRFRYRVE